MNTIGRYQLIEQLGQGGMGTVFKAFDPLLARVVAVKVISAQLGGSSEHHERFFREARAAAHLSHRNIITIYDLGEENGTPFLAMEFLEGRDLEQRMRANERMPLARKLELAIGVCDGLAHAHACGIIHRDVKPANIFITDGGEVKLLDFGLARLVTSEITKSHAMLGTVNYMAPEQIRAEKLDHRADIFSLGVVLYELLGGRKAFKADSFASTLYQILQETPEPLERIAPEVPAGLSGLVERAMAKAREDRYQHVTDIARDLEHLYTGTHGADLRFVRTWDASARQRSGNPPPETDVSDAPTMAGGPPAPDSNRVGSGSRPRTGRPTHETAGDETAVLPDARATLVVSEADRPRSAVPSPVVKPSGRRASMLAVGAVSLLVVLAVASWAWRASSRIEPAAPPAAAHASSPTPPAAAAPPRVETPADPAPLERPVASDGEHRDTPTVPGIDPARLTRALREARSALAAGRLDDASSRVAEVLRGEPGNRDALALRTRIATALTAHAERSLADMDAARRGAVAAGAPTWAADLLAVAERRASAARTAFADRQFDRASSGADEAGALFRDAEAAARRLAADADRRRSSDAERARSAEAERARAAEAERLRAEAARAAPAPPSAPAPPPAAAPPPPAGPSAEQAIADVVRRYANALEQRDLAALRAVWPTIGAAQEAAIRADFDNARSIEASIRDLVVEVSGDAATATGHRQYVVRTRDGQRLQSDTTTTMHLRRNGGQWAIQSIRHQAR